MSKTTNAPRGPLVTDAPMTPAAFRAEARRRGRVIGRFKKFGPVAARPAEPGERVETVWNGAETVKTAKTGDWLLTALDKDGAPLRDGDGQLNQWLISGEKFRTRYAATNREIAEGRVHLPTGVVEAFYLPSGFDIAAPWGERQRAARGYLLLSGDDVYGNHAETFVATYRRIRRPKT